MDASYMAKHFLIKALPGANGVARHYTICNAMRPDLYQALINALKPVGDEDQAPVDDELLDTEHKPSMTFCIKNYGSKYGLSPKLTREEEQEN